MHNGEWSEKQKQKDDIRVRVDGDQNGDVTESGTVQYITPYIKIDLSKRVAW